MIRLNKEELNNINGGTSGAVISSIIRTISTILDMGRMLGSAIRRLSTRRYC